MWINLFGTFRRCSRGLMGESSWFAGWRVGGRRWRTCSCISPGGRCGIEETRPASGPAKRGWSDGCDGMIWELVRKDLRLFTADRKALITTIGVPIALASFMAAIYGGMNSGGGGGGKMNAVPMALVDEDGSAISR